MPDSSPHGSTPRTVGLCPEPDCGSEFYMPDAKAGDRCPHGHDGEPPELVIYAMATSGGVQPSAEAIEVAGKALYAYEAGGPDTEREQIADAVAREFGDKDKKPDHENK